MQQDAILIGVAAFLVLVVGPLLFGLRGITRFRGSSGRCAAPSAHMELEPSRHFGAVLCACL